MSMLATRIIESLLSDPITWAVVVVSAWAEVATARWLLRRMAVDVSSFTATPVLVQFLTWFAFLAFGDWLAWHYEVRNCIPLVATELMVVVAEYSLLRAAGPGWFLGRLQAPLTIRQAALVAALGNVVAIAAIVGIFVCFALLAAITELVVYLMAR
ncbi:MAG TPA: hypothetical protein VF384_19390 [Planctomycetota bacterium]